MEKVEDVAPTAIQSVDDGWDEEEEGVEEVEVVKSVREEEVRNCEERSDELRMRQFRSLFD